MEICHFFVIFYDFVIKCVYKSTIYTFVIRDKIWTPPFVVQKCTCYFCVLGPENTPPTPYMSGTFVLAPPPTQAMYRPIAPEYLIDEIFCKCTGNCDTNTWSVTRTGNTARAEYVTIKESQIHDPFDEGQNDL